VLWRLIRRLLVVAVVVGVSALWVAVVIEWRRYSDEGRALSHQQASETAPSDAATRPNPTPTRVAPVKRRSTGRRGKQPVERPGAIVLNAVTGASWLEVRDSSASGTLLYEGTLGTGGRLRYRPRTLWVRIGAGENIAIRVRGRQVHDVPAGTTTVLVTPRRVQMLELG
jgi:hypothetical protein